MNIEREQILGALRRATDPRGLRFHEVVASLGADRKGGHRVRALLAELQGDGAIEKAEGQRYRIIGWVPAAPPSALAAKPKSPTAAGKKQAPAGQVSGTIRVHPAGYGFVVRDDGEDDVFVAARNRGPALDGDRVALTTWLGYKGTEGRVAEVLERGRARLTGTLRSSGRVAYLEPDDPRILGHVRLAGDGAYAAEGQAVVAEITLFPTQPDEPLEARVIRVLGDPDDPRTEVAKVIACAEIPDEFPAEVVQAAERTPQEVLPSDLGDRVDLRDRGFLTIDPETARDFDDAVCVEDGPTPSVERLWVAVADVSHYVRTGSALDAEARVRGVSVYLPDRAIPMLPHQLSSGICSLNPDVERLAMVARVDVDKAGQVVDAQMMAAVIRSRARLDYAGVAAALGGDLRGSRARYRDHLPQLERLQKLSHRLRAVRHERGSLDFDLPEASVILDEDDPRRVRDVRKSRALPEVKEAYRIVEDCMLAANEAVARFFQSRGLDTLWRIHDAPKLERLVEFSEIAQSFGVRFTAEDGRSPKKLRDFLSTIEGKPMERALSYLLLRSLKQAVYDVNNVGHFGLAAPAYLHFTSPIRRYPDLVVHRLLKRALRAEGLASGGGEAYAPRSANPDERRAELQQWASESSSNERRAMEAEREVVDMYRAWLMRDRVGEEYDGTIAGVMAFGFFVEISEPFVEGLVKIDSLGGDRYELDERTVRLVGRTTGQSFALGDTVRVRIENVSVQRRKIDMILVEHAETAPRATTAPGRAHGRKHEKHEKNDRSGKPAKPAHSDGHVKPGRRLADVIKERKKRRR